MGECDLLSWPRFANAESRHPACRPLTYVCILKELQAGSPHSPPPISSCFQGVPRSPSRWGSILLSPALGEARFFSPVQEGHGLWVGVKGGVVPASLCPLHPLGGCHEDALGCHSRPMHRACSANVPIRGGQKPDMVPSPPGF